MKLRCKFGPQVALAGALLLVCVPVRAQWLRNVAQTPLQQRRAQRQLRRQQLLNGMPAATPNNPMRNNPMPRVFERLQDMPPDRQEKFLQNNQRFQDLPGEQQSIIRQRLQAWNRLTPEQQQEFRQRQRVWEEMTPQQRQQVRQNLLPRWQQLPPQRRQAILQHLHALRDLSESERQTKLNDPAFVEGLSSEERDTLSQLAHLHVGMGESAPN